MNKEIEQDTIPDGVSVSKQRIHWFLAAYFILTAGILLRFLTPLPEQKPIIEFSGFAAVLYSLLFAVIVLRSRSRWLLLSLFLSLPGIAWVISQKNHYLTMALEESSLLHFLPWTIIPVALILFHPTSYRYFSDKYWQKTSLQVLFKKGFPW
jgi:hypothetical protein